MSIVKNILTTIYGAHSEISGNVAFAVDVSGSTHALFNTTVIPNYERFMDATVLGKEISVMRELIDGIPLDKLIYATFFSTVASPIRKIVRMANGFYTLPKIDAGGITNTHEALKMISIHPELNITRLIIITDGQTNSTQYDLDPKFLALTTANVSVEIIAVTTSNVDLTNVHSRDELRLPGMDLINRCSKDARSIKVYSSLYVDIPFTVMVSVPKKKTGVITLRGYDLPSTIPFPVVVNTLIDKMMKASDISMEDTQIMLTEIGSILTLMTVEFPENAFTKGIATTISSTRSDMFTYTDVIDTMMYGFYCERESKPVLLSRLGEHINEMKAASVRREDFSDASRLLSMKGATLGDTETLSVSADGRVIIDKVGRITKQREVHSFPNSGDENGFVYVGSSNEQATRQALRAIFNDPRSEVCIFQIANIMLKHFVCGEKLNSYAMSTLRRYAIIQCGKSVMLSKGNYTSEGVYTLWKNGQNPAMHYSKPDTHASLFKHKNINSFGLSETEWWAAMMLMLGIFEEQHHCYESFLSSVGCITVDDFKNRLINENISKITPNDNHRITIFDDAPKSTFTFDEFPPGATITKVSEHMCQVVGGNPTMCNATIFALRPSEEDYFLQHGCPFCRGRLTADNFSIYTDLNIGELVSQMDRRNGAFNMLTDLGAAMSDLSVDAFPSLPTPPVRQKSTVGSQAWEKKKAGKSETKAEKGTYASPPAAVVPDAKASSSADNVSTFSRNTDGFSRDDIVIAMEGITGSGKSTSSEMLAQKFSDRGIPTCIVSADEFSKVGKNPRDEVPRKIRNFLAANSGVMVRAFIVDLCNEMGFKTKIFDFDVSHCRILKYTPNFNPNDVTGYEMWAFTNVMDRDPSSKSTNYWLTSHTPQGRELVVKVHNQKMEKFRQTKKIKGKWSRPISNNSPEEIHARAAAYAGYLSTRDLDVELNDLISVFF
jgi:hypothetical protein